MSQSNCFGNDVLLALHLGTLPEDSADEVIEHVADCCNCQAVLETFSTALGTVVVRLRCPAVVDLYAEEPHCQEALARMRAHGGRSRVQAGSAATAIPHQLGEYQLLEKLGEGGMGAVYKVLQTKLDKVVALKILPKDRMNDGKAVARFEREMKAVGALDHPNIVRAMHAGETDATPYLVVEYVDGVSLSELVRSLGPLPVRDACEIVRQAAVGLQYAHEHGLVHRDIKPSNLMLNRQGQVKILDLGLALLEASPPSGEEMTAAGQAMGTADYMAPEQTLNSHAVDIRADIYSLGCTLYKLLTGRTPFAAYKSRFQKMMAHVQEPILPVRNLRPEVPEELAIVLGRLLAKNPEDRFATPIELADAMASLAIWEEAEGCVEDVTGRLVRLVSEARRKLCVSTATTTCPTTEPFASSALAATASSLSRSKAGERLGRWTWKRWAMLVTITAALLALGILIRIRIHDGKMDVTVRTEGHQVPRFVPGRKGRAARGGAKSDFAMESPPLAVAPFDAEQARGHQQAWAEYLRVPVERRNSLGMEFRLIPPGAFLMGSTREDVDEALLQAKRYGSDEVVCRPIPTEMPQHPVTLGQPFYLGTHEVTVQQFRHFVEATGYKTDAEKDGQVTQSFRTASRKFEYSSEHTWQAPGFLQADNCPVTCVSWNDAVSFCRWLSSEEEKDYRLPTEAEWEYACRAGTTKRWHCGDEPGTLKRAGNLGDHAFHEMCPSAFASVPWDDGYPLTAPVGEYEANAFGLHDMHGNVFEWCQDRYLTWYYTVSPASNPKGPEATTGQPDIRVLRGGGWCETDVTCRSAFRASAFPSDRRYDTGFRVVLAFGPGDPSMGRE